MTSAADTLSIQTVEHALRRLYDPVELGRSALVGCFTLPVGSEGSVLRRLLLDAIGLLKPSANLPRRSKAWHIYNVLVFRFIEQSNQKQVADDMALSTRQLRRLEIVALQTLADILLQHPARSTAATIPGISSAQAPSNPLPPGTEQELELLRHTLPCESIDTLPFIESMLRTAAPLMQSLGTKVNLTQPAELLPPVYGQFIPLRQGIINLLTAVGQCVPQGQVELVVNEVGSTLDIQVSGYPAPGKEIANENLLLHEAVKLGSSLVELSGGCLRVNEGSQAGLSLDIFLPTPGQSLVLVLDDNQDTLRLIERYLAGSCYRQFGLQDPASLILKAETLKPDVIVLDVMLPSVDGWELLGRLREHPRLGQTPVIISTILPQENLAMALGAAAFLRKPVSQESFLLALDRLTKRQGPGST